jgi:hypothetical protein
MGKFLTYLRHNLHHENEDDDDQLEWLLKLENPNTHIFVKALGLGPSNQHFGHGWKHYLILKYIYLQKQTIWSTKYYELPNFIFSHLWSQKKWWLLSCESFNILYQNLLHRLVVKKEIVASKSKGKQN